MNEFKHWLDESSEADDFERAILRSGSMVDPTDSKRDQVWSNVLGALAIVPAATAASTASTAGTAKVVASGASKASAVWLGVGKGFVVGLALYGAASGVAEIAERFSAHPAPVASAPHAALVASVASVASGPRALPALAEPMPPPLAPAVSVEPAPASTVSSAALTSPSSTAAGAAPSHSVPLEANPLPSVAAFGLTEPPTTSAVRASQLKAEAAALSSAREALRAGRLTDAFAQLEASRRQFSAPELYQEREALTIELLSRSSQVVVAQQRADSFLKRFPESPHADQIRRFATH